MMIPCRNGRGVPPRAQTVFAGSVGENEPDWQRNFDGSALTAARVPILFLSAWQLREFVMADLATKADLQGLKSDLQTLSAHFDAKLDTLSLRLTVRLGTMLVIGLGALATILKLT
jgi:hypothetical protein